ncbi:MAG: SDR family oxidoreductase [Myxococcota bacterium]
MTLTFSPGVWLVTGASSGIGAATAQALARAGATVALAARRFDTCAALAAALRSEGHRAEAYALDICDRDAVFALMEKLAKHPEGLAGAFNNAARLEPAALLAEMDPTQVRQTMETNVLGQIWCLQAQLPLLQQRRSGAIVLTGSIAEDAALPALAPYAASKAAVRSIVRSTARGAFEHGVRINLLSPGPTHTPMGHDAFGGAQALDAASANSSAGRGAQVEEAAAAALWLLSEQAGFINGAELVVDGGYSLGG